MMAVMRALVVQQIEAHTDQQATELLPTLSENMPAPYSLYVTAWMTKESHTWHGSQAVAMVLKNKMFYHLEVVLDLM